MITKLIYLFFGLIRDSHSTMTRIEIELGSGFVDGPPQIIREEWGPEPVFRWENNVIRRSSHLYLT